MFIDSIQNLFMQIKVDDEDRMNLFKGPKHSTLGSSPALLIPIIVTVTTILVLVIIIPHPLDHIPDAAELVARYFNFLFEK